MAKLILKDVLPVEIGRIMEDALMTNKNKMEKLDVLTNYTIQAIGRDIDEIRGRL